MDKNAIKKYAVWARQELIERVSQRAMLYGIAETNTGDPQADSVNGRLLSPVEKRQRAALIEKIKREGYEQVMEATGGLFGTGSAELYMNVEPLTEAEE